MTKFNIQSCKTVEDFKELRDRLIADHLEAFFRAPTRSSYNPVTRAYAQTKSNISRATKQNLRELDTWCFGMLNVHIWEDADEEVVSIGKPVDPT